MQLNRRQFLYYSALATAGAGVLAGCTPAKPKPKARVIPSGDKLRIAAVGAGGKGRSDIAHCGKEEIVALCDADENMAAEARKRFPNAKFYFDWRDMLEKEQNNIDAIT
ncbi:MAG TPA: twin-arginine translocation signal domain-containing protein, partial [Verrucomicrobiota bacterium]|nr:twin-arginine translocation signal domain-containing protein [Verrucomicrobiota bacterium]